MMSGSRFVFLIGFLYLINDGLAQTPYCISWQKPGSKAFSFYSNYTYSTILFDDPSLNVDDTTFSNQSGKDIILVKRDSRGNKVWAKAIDGLLNQSVEVMDVDSVGAVYIGGTFTGTMQADNISITSNGNTDIFLCKYTSSGKLEWLKNFGSLLNDNIQALVIDKRNHLRIALSFSGEISVGPYHLTESGGTLITASLLTENAEVIYANNFSAPPLPNYLKMDQEGYIYLAGQTTQRISIGNTVIDPRCPSLYSSIAPSFWVAAFDTTGILLWARDFLPCTPQPGVEIYHRVYDFYVDKSGFIYLVFTEGAWNAQYGPSPGDPYLNRIQVYSPEGNFLEGSSTFRQGMIYTADIERHILYARDRKVLLNNYKDHRIEYVKDLKKEVTYLNGLISIFTPIYLNGYVDSTESSFYISNTNTLSKLNTGLLAIAGADKNKCFSDTSSFNLGGDYYSAQCGNPPYSYKWSPSTGLSSSSIANPKVNIRQLSNYQKYVLTVTDAAGSQTQDSVIIKRIPEPVKPTITSLNNKLIIHPGKEVNISWYWNDIPVGEFDSTLAFMKDGEYKVKLNGNYNCTVVSDSFIAYRIIANAGNDTAICKHDSIRLGGSPTASSANSNLSYNWQPANSLNNHSISNPMAQPDSSMKYLLAVNDNYGNTVIDSIQIQLFPSPPVSISQNGNILSSGISATTQWYLNGQALANETKENLVISQEGKYVVRITNSSGCSSISQEYFATPTLLKVSVFPTVASGNFNIRYNLPLPANVSVEIINMGYGIRKIIRNNSPQDAGEHSIQLFSASFSKGAYLVRVSTSNTIASSKFVVQ